MRALVLHRTSAGTSGATSPETLQLFAERQGWVVQESTLVEEGEPKRRQLLRLDGARPFDVLVMSHLARVWPSTPAALRGIGGLLDEGIDLVAVDQGINTTTWPSELRTAVAGLLHSLSTVDKHIHGELVKAGLHAGNTPARHRTAIDLEDLAKRWHAGETHRDMAKALSTPEASVSTRSVGRAIRRMLIRGELEPHHRFQSLHRSGSTAAEIKHNLRGCADAEQVQAWLDHELDEIH